MTELRPGLTHQARYAVTAATTVPRLAVESAEIAAMPAVLATPYMIAMMEIACTALIARHAKEGEGSLGIRVDVTHLAATLPGQTVTVDVEVTAVASRKITFKVTAHDGIDKIGEGMHERIIVPWSRIQQALAAKAQKAGGDPT